MMNATVHHADKMNELEMIQVADYMEKQYPTVLYTMTPGNDCIWVYFSFMNLYFIFRNGRIADVQVD